MQKPVGPAPGLCLCGIVDLPLLQRVGAAPPPPAIGADGVADAVARDLAGRGGVVMEQEDLTRPQGQIMPGEQVAKRVACPDGRDDAPACLSARRFDHGGAHGSLKRKLPFAQAERNLEWRGTVTVVRFPAFPACAYPPLPSLSKPLPGTRALPAIRGRSPVLPSRSARLCRNVGAGQGLTLHRPSPSGCRQGRSAASCAGAGHHPDDRETFSPAGWTGCDWKHDPCGPCRRWTPVIITESGPELLCRFVSRRITVERGQIDRDLSNELT